MPMTNNLELKALIADYLKRTDQTTNIIDWIRLTEKRIVRKFQKAGLDRELLAKKTTTAASTVPVPSRARGLPHTVYLDTNPRRVLDYVAPDEISRYRGSTDTGKPVAYTVIANEIVMMPAPDTAYSTVIVYQKEPDIAYPYGQSFIPEQDETHYDNSPSTEGSINAGTNYSAGDEITLSDGTVIDVLSTVGLGQVSTFRVASSGLSDSVSTGDQVAQSSTTGSGVNFALEADEDNLAPAVFIKYPELYLYGALAEGFHYLRNTAEGQRYGALWTEAFESIESQAFHSAGALQIHMDNE